MANNPPPPIPPDFWGSLIQAGPENRIPTLMSNPDAYLRHNISDEDIDVFVTSSRDGLTDVMWGSVGACLGAFPSAVDHLIGFCGNTPLSIAGLAQIVIFFVSLALSGAIFTINKRKSQTASDHAAKIRARTRTPQKF